MRRLFALALLAAILFSLCVQGARWQFDRYEIRHERNEMIRANIAKPSVTEIDLTRLPQSETAWREIELRGNFQPSVEILARNRYFQERYGLGVITLFESESGKRYWVDRGWVAPGPDASTPPVTKKVTDQALVIQGRVRVEDIENQVGGSVFALPGSTGNEKLALWNRTNQIDAEPVYFDLISASDSRFNPDYPTELPALSDGPHLAYAFQWIFFAGLVLFALVFVIREDRKAQREKT